MSKILFTKKVNTLKFFLSNFVHKENLNVISCSSIITRVLKEYRLPESSVTPQIKLLVT